MSDIKRGRQAEFYIILPRGINCDIQQVTVFNNRFIICLPRNPQPPWDEIHKQKNVIKHKAMLKQSHFRRTPELGCLITVLGITSWKFYCRNK